MPGFHFAAKCGKMRTFQHPSMRDFTKGKAYFCLIKFDKTFSVRNQTEFAQILIIKTMKAKAISCFIKFIKWIFLKCPQNADKYPKFTE